MKVLIAGASGALGTPLTRALIAGGHEVLGLARSPESIDRLTHLGAHPILANVMDRDDLLRAVKGVQADAVIHALTALKKTPLRPQDMYATNALRYVGTTNLLAAAREVGAHRFVAESMTLGYGYGTGAKRSSLKTVRSHLLEALPNSNGTWPGSAHWSGRSGRRPKQAGSRGYRCAMDTFMGQHLSSLSWRSCAAEAFLCLMGAARSPPGFIWKMRQPPRSHPSNGARQEKRITSSMTNRYTIKTSSRSSASRLTSRGPFHSQAG